MNKTIAPLLFAALLGLADSALAQDYRIGVVDADKIVELSPQYDAVRKALELEFKRRSEDLAARQAQLRTLEEKLAADTAGLSADESRRLEQDIRSQRRKLKTASDEYREDLSLRSNEERRKLVQQVSEVVHQIGEEERFDVILSIGIVYASERVNLTGKVLERLKAQFK